MECTLRYGAVTPRASIAIFAGALALRLAHAWQMRGTLFFDVLMGDSHGYDLWAQQLAAGDWIGRDVFYQAPLYPYFLGAIYALAGRALFAVRVVQALIGAASCVALGAAAARLVSPRAGVVAGIMLAIYPPAIFADGLLQKSVLDVFFVCLALALVARIATGQARRMQWALLGLTMGALALTRENALVLAAVIGVWAMRRGTTDAAGATHTKITRPLVSFVIGLAVVLLPVAARNAAVGGGFYLTTSQLGSNLYIGNNPGADGSYASLRPGRGSPEYERLDATELAEEAAGRQLTPGEVSAYWTRRTLAFIVAQPADWLRLLARKARLLASSTEIIDTESQESHADYSWPLRVLGRVWHFGVLLPFAMIGAIVLWPDRRRLGVLYALTLAYAATVVIFFVVARYRLPLVPFLMVFAAAGLLAIRASVPPGAPRRTRQRLAASAWMAAAVAAVVSNWPLYTAASQRAITENNLGTALQERGRAEEAIDHYREALALDQGYVPAMNNLGTALRAAGRPDEALAVYARALENGAAGATLHVNRGNALMTVGRRREAIEAFRQALVLEPRSTHARDALANALYDEGTMLLAAGAYPQAVTAFREGLRVRPGSAEAHNNLGIALASQGRLGEAVVEWEAALRLRPDFADARLNLERAKGR